MELDILSYHELYKLDSATFKSLESILLTKGIVGIRDVPDFVPISQNYINAARAFTALDETIKNQYVPNRDAGLTEGYELGAEWFKDEAGEWQIDDKKASFYAYVPDNARNQWPREMDLKTPYQALGQLIFNVGKVLMKAIGLDEVAGVDQSKLSGYGRLLHYHKVGELTNANPNWCGAHLDHGLFTGLLPAYYYRNGELIPEPNEAGLFIVPSNGTEFEKVHANDPSVLMFQVGEFAQVITNDRIKATRHIVKKAYGDIDRYTFALFYNAAEEMVVNSKSILAQDARYLANQRPDGTLTYADWSRASFERYRAR